MTDKNEKSAFRINDDTSIFICPGFTKTQMWQSHIADRTVRTQWN